MRHRSFYMRAEDLARLQEAVDDLYYSTRKRRHEVLAALIGVALAHRAEIEAWLKERAA
jgi:hypothetical protein